MERFNIVKNLTIDGKYFKVVDPHDSCSSLNKVLAKHEVSELITPAEYTQRVKLWR